MDSLDLCGSDNSPEAITPHYIVSRSTHIASKTRLFCFRPSLLELVDRFGIGELRNHSIGHAMLDFDSGKMELVYPITTLVLCLVALVFRKLLPTTWFAWRKAEDAQGSEKPGTLSSSKVQNREPGGGCAIVHHLSTSLPTFSLA